MKRFFIKTCTVMLTAVFLISSLLTELALASEPMASINQTVLFSDVPADSWAVNVIESAVQNGLMSGMGDGTFGYGSTITRAQFVTILGNMFGWGNDDFLSASHGFRDVSTDHWFFDAVENAYKQGVIEHGDMFSPNAPILRQDMAVMLIKALGYSTLAEQVERFEANPFSDVDARIGYIIIAHDIGMISGIGDGQFAPSNTATREQAAAMITRVYDRLNAPISWVHGFYAFGSFGQRNLIRDMDAVSFGWSQMEWDTETGARLNTTAVGDNPWVIPSGYELIANFPRENNATSHLNVFMDTTMNLDNMLANSNSRTQAVNAILYEATRIYTAIDRSPFDGVTINFEGLRDTAARSNFNAFLTELSHSLRLAGLTLFVTVHPATIDGIYFDGYDFRAIGQLADKVILMVHDYHPRSLEGFLGTQWQRHAALTPISEVYRSLKAITDPITGVEDRDKVVFAFSFPNIGWFVDENNNAISSSPISVSMETAAMRMSQADTYFGWSETHRNPYIIYTTENGDRVFLWFENSRSIYEKLKLSRLFGITRTSVWRMGIIPNENEWDVWENFLR